MLSQNEPPPAATEAETIKQRCGEAAVLVGFALARGADSRPGIMSLTELSRATVTRALSKLREAEERRSAYAVQRQIRNAAPAAWEAWEAAKAAGYPAVQRRVAAAVVGGDGKRRVEPYSRSVDKWLDELAEEFSLDEMLRWRHEMARSTR